MSHLILDQESASLAQAAETSPSLDGHITVLVVDDHALVRSAISQALSSQTEIKRIVLVRDYAEAENQSAKLQPDIIWLDMHIAHSDGIAEIRRLRQLSPSARIIALADVEDEQQAFAAIMAGVQGYCSKQDVDQSEIITMIHMVLRDEIMLRPTLMTRMVKRLRAAALPLWGTGNGGEGYRLLLHGNYNGLEHLTVREREILQLISQGYRDRDIAKGLHISEKTVQKHVQSVLTKLGAQNRTQAAYLMHSQSLP